MQIPKSRYDSVDLYISEVWMNRPEYNDSPLPIDQALYDRMRKHGEFPAEPAIAFSSALINRGMQESTNYFPNTSPTYLFVILLLYFPSSSIKTTVRAQTISRCVHFLLPFFFFASDRR